MLNNYAILNIYANIYNPKTTKNNTKGNKTKNHAIFLYPPLHIKFNTHVQNNTYNNFNT